MPAKRYNRFKRKPGRVGFAVDDDDSSTGDDVELGQYMQSHDESTASSPSQSRARAHRPFLSSSHHPSSSRSQAKRSAWQSWPTGRNRQRPASRAWTKAMTLSKTCLMLLGLLQCLSFICGILSAFFPDELDLVSGPFKDSFTTTQGPPEAWTEDLTADVQPLMCHSHNDYWRREPLHQAIRVGCTGVESDIWHINDELYVAHTPSGIRPNRTLKSLYLDPLKELLDRQNQQLPDFLGPLESDHTLVNGVFATDRRQSLVLLIDFKNDPDPTWHRLNAALDDFRERNYLTYFNGTSASVVQGPLTVVVSGLAPFNRIVQSSAYRDIFYDAPLDIMGTLGARGGGVPLPPPPPPPLPLPLSLPKSVTPDDAKDASVADLDPPGPDHDHDYPRNAAIYSPANSYYASVSFMHSIGYPWHSALSQAQLDLLRRQIRGAHARGLKVRYYGIPAWPVGLRNYIWRVLVREGVDYLSVDDVDAVTRHDWGPRKGGWGKKWWR